MESHDIDFARLWQQIVAIVNLTLLSIAHTVPDSPCCFELFGFGTCATGLNAL